MLLLAGQNPTGYGLAGMAFPRLQENNLSSLATSSLPGALSRLLPQPQVSDASTLLALHRAQQVQAELLAATQQREQQLLIDRAVEGLLSRELAAERSLQLQQQQRVAMPAETGPGPGEDERVDAAAARRGRNWLPPLGPPPSSAGTQNVAFPGGTPTAAGSAVDRLWMTRNAETFASLMGKGEEKQANKKPPARKK